LFFIGAFLVALTFPFLRSTERCQLHQFSGVLYTWVLASGAGYFFWNKVLLNTGSLAIMNNALIPVD
jgi:hypothetical protein